MATKIVSSGNTIVKRVTVGVPAVKRITSSVNINSGIGGVDTTGKSEGDILVYDSATSNFIVLGFSDTVPRQAIRSLFSSGGDLNYDSATGTFSFDVEQIYTKSNFDSDFNIALDEAAIGGSGLTYDNATNTLNIDSSELSAYYLTRIGSNLIPLTDSAYDLGTPSLKWKSLYLSGSTIYLGDISLQDQGGSFAVKDSLGDPAPFNLDGNTTSDLAEGSNLYYSTARADSAFDTRLATKTTDDLNEGINLYYTRARFDNDLGDLTTVATVRGYFSAEGDLTYDEGSGTFSFDVEQVYTKSNFDSDFNSALDDAAINGDGLSYDNNTNKLSITATGVDSGTYGSSTQIPVFTVNDRGQIDSIGTVLVAGVTNFNFDSSNGQFTINTADGNSFTTVATLDPYTTTTLAEGDNLYYTTARADSDARHAISGSGDISYDPNTGVISIDVEEIYTKANFDSDFNVALDEAALGGVGLTYNSGANTLDITNTGVVAGEYGSATQVPIITVNAQGQIDSIGEILVAGVTNFEFDSANGQFTISTADGNSFTTVATLDPYTTTTLAEGDNLYYTTARANSAIDARVTKSFVDALNVDADTFDTLNSTQFLRSDVADTKTSGDLNFSSDVKASFGNNNALDIYYSSQNVYINKTDGNGDLNITSDTDIDLTANNVNISGTLVVDSAVVNGINFNATPGTYSSASGALYWDSDPQKGLSFTPTTNEGNSEVTINIGQESLIYVHNQTGETISNGDIVYISGTAHGQHPKITKAKADVAVSGTVAMATMDMVDNAHGYVTRFGLVRDLNTGGLTAGADVYLSADSAGKFTTDNVTVDNGYPIHIGKIVRVDSSTGSILIDPFTEHFEYLRISDRLKVSGKLEADSASLLNIQFNTTLFDSHQPYSEGLLYYDNAHKTLNYNDDITGMVHEIGIQEHQRVWNDTGALIRKGQPLYFSGNYTSGIIDVPTVALADATDVNAYNAQGIAAQDIPHNSYGHCLIAGQLTEVNTTGLSNGTNFFVGLGPGLVQNASPTYPNFPMCLGWVVETGDSNTGILLVNQQNHSVNSFRVRTSAHIGADLQVDGNLTVLGTQTTVGQANVTQGAPFYRLNEGDAIGEAGTVFTGTGLDDAFFAGHFTGLSPQTYYVRIDGVGTGAGGVDTFEVALGNDSAFTSPILTKQNITGSAQLIHSADNISVDFGTSTGHDSGDRWSGTASPINVDTGFFTNRNTGTSGVGYTHMGFFFDVSDEKWKVIDEYDSSPTGIINVTDSSLGILMASGFEGALTGDVTGNASTASALSSGRNFSITGDVTAFPISFDGTGNVALNAAITANSIINADINTAAAIADIKLATISTAGKVQNSATTATSANTGSAIVARDVSGNFTAGTITASLTGTASNASNLNSQAPSYYLDYTNFTNVPTVVSTFVNDANYLDSTTVSGVINSAYVNGLVDSVDNATNAIVSSQVTLTNTTTSANFYIPFATGNSTGDYALKVDEGLRYNPNINSLVTTGFQASSISSTIISLDEFSNNSWMQWGASYDAKMFYDGVDNTMELELEAAAQSFIITDNGTVRYTFNKSTSNLVASTFTGNATNALKLDSQDGSYYLNYNNFTNTPTIPPLGVDSADVSAIITSDVDAAFINALTIDADTLGGQNSAYHLDYTNFTNTPSNVSTFVNDANYLDSTTVQGVINSAYVNGLVDSVDNATNALVASRISVSSSTNPVANYYFPLVNSSNTGNYTPIVDTGIRFTPSSNYLTIDGGINIASGSFTGIWNTTDGSSSSKYIAWGNSYDTKMFYDGVNNTMEMELEADAQSFIITDNGTTRFTFDKTSGNLSLGNVTLADSSSSPNVTTNKLYSVGGTLFYNGGLIAGGTDSATVIGLISSTVDSTYVQTRQITYTTADFTDSAYVNTQISTAINNLVDGAPVALDTLNELAAALGDDSNFAGTVTTALAGKQATLVSGTNIKTINGSSILGSGDIVIAAGSSVTTDLNPPGSASDGDLWFDETSATLFIYYTDSDTSQWVQIGGGGGGGGGGSSLANLRDSGTDVIITGDLIVDSNGTFAGDVTAVDGTFTGDVTAVDGTFTGDVTAANFNTTSDARIKTNIEPISNAIDIVKQLEGVFFDKNGEPDLGLIAQQVEKVLPRASKTLNDPMQTKTVNYGGLVGVLIEAVKSNTKEIDDLKLQVKQLMEIVNGRN